MATKRRDDNWIDGLRGVASFAVVTGHLCTAFIDYLHNPALEEGKKALLFQHPILRLCVGGRAAVALFFIITGYVNSANPLRNLENGAIETAFTNLAKSAFMRTWRLVLPTATAVFIGWILFQLGMFRMAKLCDSFWISFWIRNPEETFWGALWRLSRAETEFWMTANPVYNATLWTVPFFLHGSMMVYLTILATAFVTAKARFFIILGLFVLVWCGRQPIEHTNVFFGLLMAQVNVIISSKPAPSPDLLPSSPALNSDQSSLHRRRLLSPSAVRLLTYPLPALTILLGLFACSYPERNPKWAPWSRRMESFMEGLAPHEIDLNRYWMTVGGGLLFVGIHFSPMAQRVLTSSVFNFLGRCSFPVYLMHDQIMRTVLVWMVYGGSEVTKDKDGKLQPLKRGGIATFCVAIPIFYACTYVIAWLWMNHLDPQFARITMWLKNLCWRSDTGRNTQKPPAWSAEKGPNLV